MTYEEDRRRNFDKKIKSAVAKGKNIYEVINRCSSAADFFEPVPATQPASSLPGTEERISDYIARVERGEEVFNEEDRNHYDRFDGV